jgi:23S rRNA (cytosine1962-C5)-methyltransferase
MRATWPDYELVDFGGGRKLERFGGRVFDRPAPQAEGITPAAPAAWKLADAVYTGDKVGGGKWRSRVEGGLTTSLIDCPCGGAGKFQLAIEPSATGQVGVFPEQFTNWQWIAREVGRVSGKANVLNLFGYTGGSTLAAAIAGAEVTHVDSSKPAVTTARTNAKLSGLEQHPIRWIVEDVLVYCRREVQRGRQYDAVIVDPPSYGHGPKGQAWQLTRDLPELLALCRQLTEARRLFVLATCHTPGVGAAELSAYLSEGLFGHCGQPPATGQLWLEAKRGRRLESGVYARWPK